MTDERAAVRVGLEAAVEPGRDGDPVDRFLAVLGRGGYRVVPASVGLIRDARFAAAGSVTPTTFGQVLDDAVWKRHIPDPWRDDDLAIRVDARHPVLRDCVREYRMAVVLDLVDPSGEEFRVVLPKMLLRPDPDNAFGGLLTVMWPASTAKRYIPGLPG